MATIYQVSKLAGVSLATVSRVINHHTRVSEKTRIKVQEAMDTLGYRPSSIAQSLASNCTNSVGILVSELHGAYFGQMMAGIESELRAAGKHVIITTGCSEAEQEKDGIEFLISRNCDAIIAHVEALSDQDLIDLNNKDVPLYLMSRYVHELNSQCISLDNELGGYLATKSIILKGHKKLAYVAGPTGKSDANARLAGHKKALEEYDIKFEAEKFYQGDFKETGGSEALRHFVEQGAEFSALICANDEMASGAMKYAREHGFELPQDLSIIGFDNNVFANYLYPKLTTIDNPIYEMGHMAAKLVLKNIYQAKVPEIKYIFSPKLIERDSIQQAS